MDQSVSADVARLWKYAVFAMCFNAWCDVNNFREGHGDKCHYAGQTLSVHQARRLAYDIQHLRVDRSPSS